MESSAEHINKRVQTKYSAIEQLEQQTTLSQFGKNTLDLTDKIIQGAVKRFPISPLIFPIFYGVQTQKEQALKIALSNVVADVLANYKLSPESQQKQFIDWMIDKLIAEKIVLKSMAFIG